MRASSQTALRNHTVSECVDLSIAASNCRRSDIIFVVPPFASPDWPSLGVHILATVAKNAGLAVRIVYANLSFARLIGPKLYRSLCVTKTGDLVGERIFRQAYSKTRDVPGQQPVTWHALEGGTPPDFAEMQMAARNWAGEFAASLASSTADLIGFSSTFEQTLSSLSIIEEIKSLSPEKKILVGGANTDGSMGAALQTFEPIIDHIFVGESEIVFEKFLSDYLSDGQTPEKLIYGQTNERLDSIPAPDFTDFFSQFDATVLGPACEDGLDRSELRVPYESSRGCWWGAKHHCTFCGLNANGMTHRIKNADKVADEILEISSKHDVEKVIMVDNIMPHPYFSTLLPRLAQAEQNLTIFYEQKSNIKIEKMMLLASAGVRSIQPGIESISTSLLKRMKKGVSAKTNIDCMRYARSCGVDIVWNILIDFPGDGETDYQEMIELMPLLHHLAPPTGISTISIDRFSPYHSDPTAYGIANLQPIDVYRELFPTADLSEIAYHFTGDYESAARRNPTLVETLERTVDGWIGAWKTDHKPLLLIFELQNRRFLLTDTRPIATIDAEIITEEQASLLLTGATEWSPAVSRFLDRGHLAEIDGKYAPICCAEPHTTAWRH